MNLIKSLNFTDFIKRMLAGCFDPPDFEIIIIVITITCTVLTAATAAIPVVRIIYPIIATGLQH